MNSNIKKVNFKTTSFLRRAFAETSVEGEVIVPDYYPGIMRIVKTEATPYIRSKTVRDDKISVEGNVCFRVLYLCENGVLRSFSTIMPFSQSIDMKVEHPLACAVSAKIAYVNTRALNPQKLYFKATISVCSDGMQESTELAVKEADEGKKIYMQTESLPTFSVVSEIQKPLRVTDEITISNKNVTQIIRYDAYTFETERKIVNGKLIVKGDMILKILYLDGETSEILSVTHKSAFSQVMEIKDADDSCVFDINCEVSDLSVSINANSAETSSSVIYDAEIFITAVAYKNTEEQLCVDAFSEENQMEITKSEIMGQSICNVKKELTVRQTVEIGQYQKIHDISVNTQLEKADYYADNGQMLITGNMLCSILYTDSEGDFASAEKQIPFEVQLPVSAGGSAAIAKCVTNIGACAFVEVDDRNIEVRADAVCFGTVGVLMQKEIVTNAEITDSPIPPRNAGITIYYADKGENVFSIAKRYAVDPEIIKKANGIEDFTDKKRAVII